MELGLDFGTHQSKVCLRNQRGEDESYEFFQFTRMDGSKSPLFPSVIQINKDETVSIGFVDRSNALNITRPKPEMPVIPEKPSGFSKPEPKLKLPPQPKIELDWKQQLAQASGQTVSTPELERWKVKCRSLEKKYEQEKLIWKEQNERSAKALHQWEHQVEIIRNDYSLKLGEWKRNPNYVQCYRYFKLSSLVSLNYC